MADGVDGKPPGPQDRGYRAGLGVGSAQIPDCPT